MPRCGCADHLPDRVTRPGCSILAYCITTWDFFFASSPQFVRDQAPSSTSRCNFPPGSCKMIQICTSIRTLVEGVDHNDYPVTQLYQPMERHCIGVTTGICYSGKWESPRQRPQIHAVLGYTAWISHGIRQHYVKIKTLRTPDAVPPWHHLQTIETTVWQDRIWILS